MNAKRDVHTLMRRSPAGRTGGGGLRQGGLGRPGDLGELLGLVPSPLHRRAVPVDPSGVSADLVDLAGAEAIVDRAQAHLDQPARRGDPARRVGDRHRPGSRRRPPGAQGGHERLLADSDNFWETAWLTKQIAGYA